MTSTNFENEQRLKTDCPMQYALQQIGGRWKMMILWYIHLNINRFSTLQQYIPNVTSKVLTEQLQELHDDVLIKRIVISERPAHVEYRLTERGSSLIPILSALKDWAVEDQSLHNLPVLNIVPFD